MNAGVVDEAHGFLGFGTSVATVRIYYSRGAASGSCRARRPLTPQDSRLSPAPIARLRAGRSRSCGRRAASAERCPAVSPSPRVSASSSPDRPPPALPLRLPAPRSSPCPPIVPSLPETPACRTALVPALEIPYRPPSAARARPRRRPLWPGTTSQPSCGLQVRRLTCESLNLSGIHEPSGGVKATISVDPCASDWQE